MKLLNLHDKANFKKILNLVEKRLECSKLKNWFTLAKRIN